MGRVAVGSDAGRLPQVNVCQLGIDDFRVLMSWLTETMSDAAVRPLSGFVAITRRHRLRSRSWMLARATDPVKRNAGVCWKPVKVALVIRQLSDGPCRHPHSVWRCPG